MHNLASTGNVKSSLSLNFKLWLFFKIVSYFYQIWQICQICLSWKTRMQNGHNSAFSRCCGLTMLPYWEPLYIPVASRGAGGRSKSSICHCFPLLSPASVAVPPPPFGAWNNPHLVFTDQVRSTREGNVFIHECDSVHRVRGWVPQGYISSRSIRTPPPARQVGDLPYPHLSYPSFQLICNPSVPSILSSQVGT